MSRRLAIVGILATILYVGLGVVFLRGRIVELEALPLNELGDFLAGAFGPLAIFWLVLGFFQQGEEVRINTHALRLQAEELRDSVNQQKALVKLTRDEHEERRLRAQPKFVIQGADARFPIGSALTRFTARIANVGATVTDVALVFQPDVPSVAPTRFQALSANGSVSFGFESDTRGYPDAARMTVVFVDALNSLGQEQFWMTVTWEAEHAALEFKR